KESSGKWWKTRDREPDWLKISTTDSNHDSITFWMELEIFEHLIWRLDQQYNNTLSTIID
ncbi:uncharacterized, partial [Tachysurus ichikawai]